MTTGNLNFFAAELLEGGLELGLFGAPWTVALDRFVRSGTGILKIPFDIQSPHLDFI
jgi:hypothetical protein